MFRSYNSKDVLTVIWMHVPDYLAPSW